jgi:undecaprenyl diphosphate synthase
MTNDVKEQIIPRHVGIIMDGNGRWAQARGLPRIAGHQAGVKAARRAVEACVEIGVPNLTLFTFSTENWARPSAEVAFLMRLAEDFARRELPELHRQDVRLQLLGRRDGLPSTLLETLDEAAQLTKDNRRLSLYLALNYGGRTEIIDAVRKVLTSHRNGTINGVDLDEDDFARYLYAPDLPDADIIIRTGGEHRLSNFLIWRAVGAVFWSTPVLWPDFRSENLYEGINVYVEQFTSRK